MARSISGYRSSRARCDRLERLLVASDGEPAADAALRVAKLLADRDGAEVHVVGAFSPRIPIPAPANGSRAHRFERRDRAAVLALRQKIRQQLRERIGVAWRVHLCIGHAPACIAEAARALRPSLVVLGHTLPYARSEHRPGRHTAEQVAIGCDFPVLLVPPGTDRLPRIAVTVNDGSAVSHRALSVVATVLAEDGTVRESVQPVGRALLHSAERIGADLVSMPLPGHNSIARSLLGGSVLHVLDHARGAVLITPAQGSVAPARQAERPLPMIASE